MDDEELAESIRNESEGEDAPAAEALPSREPRRSDGGGLPTWLKIGAVFTLLGAGVAFLLWGTDASDVFVYSKLVDEVMTEPDRYRERELRVEGKLRQGSVEFQAEPSCEHRFVLTRAGHEMPVRFPRCVVPDTFRDDMEMDVVVQGQLQSNGVFLANEVIPRCPSKYEMRQRQQNGEAMPHGATPAGSPGETS
jgi:cytochrome c-type biogenesis protein CcmE